MSKDYAADRAKMRSEQTRRALGIKTTEEMEQETKRRKDHNSKARKQDQRGRELFEGVEL